MSQGTINSKGSIFVSDIGALTNTGTITNYSTIVSNKAINNTNGTINNPGVILANTDINGNAPSGGTYYKPDSNTGVINVNTDMKLLPKTSFLIESGQSLVINSDAFTFDSSSTLTNEGTLITSGASNNGTIINKNTILSNSDLGNVVDGTSGGTGTYYYPDPNNNDTITISADFTLPAAATFNVPNEVTLNIPNGKTFTF